MQILISNLNFSVGENDLKAIFSSYGRVETVNMEKDGKTGTYKALITMDEGGKRAIAKLDGQVYKGKVIVVNDLATMDLPAEAKN